MQILCLVNSRRELHSEILQKKTCDIKPAVQLVMQITCKDLHWVANYQVITETNFINNFDSSVITLQFTVHTKKANGMVI